MSNEPANHTRRDIGFKGMSRDAVRRSQRLRRWLLACGVLAALSACGGNDTQVAVSLTVSTTVSATTTVPAPVTTVPVPATTVAATTTVEAPGTTSVPGESSTTLARSRPRLVLSQADGLDPKGTLITVSGSGFDTSKGVYVFVCNQATWNAKRRCIGGINMDGESPLSQWISSNPPGYAKGLTIEFGTDGSFAVPLLVRAIDESTSLIDCSKEQCGVVAFADHTRRDDRSQDVFVPISFASSK